MRHTSRAGYIDARPMSAVIIVLVGAMVLPAFWDDLPGWAKVAAIVVGIAILAAGYACTGSYWPPPDGGGAGQPDDERSEEPK